MQVKKSRRTFFIDEDQWGREKGGIIMKEFFMRNSTASSLFLISYGVLLFLLNILVYRLIALY